MTQKRLFWADLIRTVAIIGVVAIHTLGVTQSSTVSAQTVFSLLKTAVPLFVMLSGALLLGKIESESVFFQKRLLRVGVPWLFWSVVFAVVMQLSLLWVLRTQFSFLPVVIGLYVTIPLWRMVVQAGGARLVWYAVGLWLVSVGILPFLRDTAAFPLATDPGLVRQIVAYTGYLLLGSLLSERSIAEKIKNDTSFIGMAATGLVTTLIVAAYLLQTSPLSWKWLEPSSPLIMGASVCVWLLLSHLAGKLERYPRVVWIFTRLSQLSFGVFFLHELWNTGIPAEVTGVVRLSLVVLLSYGTLGLLSCCKPLRRLIT